MLHSTPQMAAFAVLRTSLPAFATLTGGICSS
jgi:hypothetical protein